MLTNNSLYFLIETIMDAREIMEHLRELLKDHFGCSL
jgi:hypothetical protein